MGVATSILMVIGNPCPICARAHEKAHPEDGPCWPFIEEERKKWDVLFKGLTKELKTETQTKGGRSVDYKTLQAQVSKPKPKIEYKTKNGYVVRMIKVPQPLSQNLGALLSAALKPKES